MIVPATDANAIIGEDEAVTTKRRANNLSRAQSILLGLLSTFGNSGVTSTVLVKLTYLMDWQAYRLHGETLTGYTYKFHHHGPNAEGNAIVAELRSLDAVGYVTEIRKASPSGTGIIWHIGHHIDAAQLDLAEDEWIAIHTVKHNYGSLGREEIVRVSKDTEPMLGLKEGEAITFEQDLLLTDEQVAADPFLKETLAAIDHHSGWISVEELRERVAE